MQVFDITNKQNWQAIKDYYELHGYAVIESGIDQEAVGTLAADLDQWFQQDSFPSEDYAMKNENRIQDAWRFDKRVKSIATEKNILALLEFLYGGEKVKPFQTLNFRNGTQQAAHSDSIHFNSEPFGMMCGVWLALEDIGDDQGPLVYYPGSQKYPEMNFEDLGLKPKGRDFREYSQAIRDFIEKESLQPAYANLKQGQALIWAANLLHGGSIRKSDKTRLSQVTHYYFDNCKYWRPSESYSERTYFSPNWIPLRDRSKLEKAVSYTVRRVRKKIHTIRRS